MDLNVKIRENVMNYEGVFSNILNKRPELLEDRFKLANVLSDILLGSRLEVNLLMFAYDIGIVNDIRECCKLDKTVKFRCVNKMMNQYGVQRDNALWAVNLWFYSYGINILNKKCKISDVIDINFSNENDIVAYVDNSTFTMYRNSSCSFIYSYNINLHGIVVEKIINIYKNIKIPCVIDKKPVVAIGRKAFANRNDVKKVILPDSIKFIGKKAFEGCSNLKSINIPDGLEKIYQQAFSMTALEKIIVPETVTDICDRAFSFCRNLSDVKLNEGLCQIGEYAFSECDSLISMELPLSIQIIGEFAFESTMTRKRIEVYYDGKVFEGDLGLHKYIALNNISKL